MGRPVVLSNGQMFVGLDENGQVHDFYYPYVGLDNLTNARSSQHKIGVWVDGVFHWTDDGTWKTKVDFSDESLVSDITLHSDDLAIDLHFNDFVDVEYNALVRCIKITNKTDKKRDVRLFMHQVFQIGRAGRADTAMYVPEDNYILDYKGRCCILIAGKCPDDGAFDQYAVGVYNIEGKVGTFIDAEDGELSNNAVEHGGVDSVIRFRRSIEPNGEYAIDYWVIAADSQSDAQVVHNNFRHFPLETRLKATREYWRDWVQPDRENLRSIQPHEQRELRKSMLIIKAHCDERGSILASGDSSIFNYGRDYYCYCWPRDGSYAVWPLIRLGQFEEAQNFFDFIRDTRHPDGYVMHKYQPDRAIGSTWHPLIHGKSKELAIQEDETAIIIFMLGEYYRVSKDRAYIENMFDSFIDPCANFLSNYVDKETGLPHASYDLWEEKFLTSTYTVCTVIAALEIASQLADMLGRSQSEVVHWRHAAAKMGKGLDLLYHPDGYFRKGLYVHPDGSGEIDYDNTLDISSLYGLYMFAKLPLDDERLKSTVMQVEKRLLNTSPIGGVIRYENDDYFLGKTKYKGNPWIVGTLWLAQYYNSTNQLERAQELVKWVLDRALPSGAMSEQFDPETGIALGVTPLVWSHAELINTMLDLARIA